MTMKGEYQRRIKISNYSETASRYISEDRRRRGASENEELPQKDGTRGRAKGENVPGHNGSIRPILGTIVFRYLGTPSCYRQSYRLRGN